MSDNTQSLAKRQSLGQRIFHFLGSMDLAITLLLTLAVASVIGTVLQQNQPYTDYLLKFGPFWFEVFEAAGLYDVYSALWFLAILTLLVISTSVCVIRNTPSMLKDMRNLRTNVQEKSLKLMRHSKTWTSSAAIEPLANELEHSMSSQGFRTKQTPVDNGILVSAMKGGANRLGYISTHLAIIIICVGGLMDGNLPLKLAEWQGRLAIETRDLPTNQIPDISRLPVGPHAFRGSINIPEGRSSQVAFVAMRDGYLVQELPFKVEVKDFRIEHYATGQPKSFESDLVIYDEDLSQPLEQTISVNHPLIYKGYAIYQASFGDGGSILSLEAWPLTKTSATEPVEFETKVFESSEMKWGNQSLRLELTSFRPFNINPDPTEEDPERLRNFGPSFGYKLRASNGEALEYINYMLPVPKNGRSFYLSGVRSSPADEFAYLYMPVDEDESLVGFSQFLQALYDDELVANTAQQMMRETLASLETSDATLQNNLEQTLITLIAMFTEGGFQAVGDFIDTALPEAERESLGSAYLSMLREMLARIYFDSRGVGNEELVTPEQLVFLEDAVDAIGSLPRYGAPVYLMLSDYEHIEASGLQIARSPGKSVVYLGCALLVIGIFILFYLPQRRFWLLLKPEQQQVTVLLAGMSNRNPREFDGYFEQQHQRLTGVAGNSHSA